jgi:hypothetical protein
VEISWKPLRLQEARVSNRASPASIHALFNRLPRHLRDELITVGRRSRNLFGRIRIQKIFDENLLLFEKLIANGATASELCKLLAGAGITRTDGAPLPEGTVTSALSRARERVDRDGAVLQPALPCAPLQGPAPPCNDLQSTAGSAETLANGLLQRRALQSPPALTPGDSSVRPVPNGPAGFDLPAHARRAAALLAEIRSENDEDV